MFVLFAQSKQDLLNTKIAGCDPETIQKLQDIGLISKFDVQLMGTYMLEKIQDSVNMDAWTFGRLIDSLATYKQHLNSVVAKYHTYGKDSVFIKVPSGEKNFIGLGEMTLEALVKRESQNLPKAYDQAKLNEHFSLAEQISKTISDLNLDENLAMLFGNVVLIKLELKEKLSDYLIGDFLEIAQRIKASKEFRPFFRLGT